MDASTSDPVLERRTDTESLKREITGPRGWIQTLVADKPRFRRVLMLGGVGLFVAIGLTVWLMSGRYTGTNNAYVHAAKLLVTTDVSGIVSTVNVKEGQFVHAGDILFRLDPAPFKIALDSARAKYAQVLLEIEAMKSDYAGMLRDIEAQETQVDLDQRNYNRDAALVKSGNVSKSVFDQTRLSLAGDRRKLQSLQEQAEAQRVKLGGDPTLPPEKHPLAMAAKANVDEASRQLDHATVRAPFDGVVTAVDSLQPGALLISALSSFSTTSAVAIVSIQDPWIEAQMKETDLTYVKAGDPVDVTIDTYPGRHWRGTIDSVSPATGSAFSILPAENASANWVKVVQRVPVRISLSAQDDAPPIRVGMSAVVKIDTGHRHWYRLFFGDKD